MTTPTVQGDSSTMTIMATIVLKPEAEAAWLGQVEEFIRQVEMTEPGTLLYIVGKHPTIEHAYVWVERYKDEAAFAAHRNTPHMLTLRPQMKEWMAIPVEVLRISQVAPR